MPTPLLRVGPHPPIAKKQVHGRRTRSGTQATYIIFHHTPDVDLSGSDFYAQWCLADSLQGLSCPWDLAMCPRLLAQLRLRLQPRRHARLHFLRQPVCAGRIAERAPLRWARQNELRWRPSWRAALGEWALSLASELALAPQTAHASGPCRWRPSWRAARRLGANLDGKWRHWNRSH